MIRTSSWSTSIHFHWRKSWIPQPGTFFGFLPQPDDNKSIKTQRRTLPFCQWRTFSKSSQGVSDSTVGMEVMARKSPGSCLLQTDFWWQIWRLLPNIWPKVWAKTAWFRSVFVYSYGGWLQFFPHLPHPPASTSGFHSCRISSMIFSSSATRPTNCSSCSSDRFKASAVALPLSCRWNTDLAVGSQGVAICSARKLQSFEPEKHETSQTTCFLMSKVRVFQKPLTKEKVCVEIKCPPLKKSIQSKKCRCLSDHCWMAASNSFPTSAPKPRWIFLSTRLSTAWSLLGFELHMVLWQQTTQTNMPKPNKNKAGKLWKADCFHLSNGQRIASSAPAADGPRGEVNPELRE